MENDKKFLVVDDCFINRIIIKTLLEKNNFKVDEAEDGKEVVNLIEEGKYYDIIWLDIQMPILDGIECTKRLRSLLNYSGKIIGVTSYADRRSYESCICAGMNDVIAKPITEESIINIAEKYMQ